MSNEAVSHPTGVAGQCAARSDPMPHCDPAPPLCVDPRAACSVRALRDVPVSQRVGRGGAASDRGVQRKLPALQQRAARRGCQSVGRSTDMSPLLLGARCLLVGSDRCVGAQAPSRPWLIHSVDGPGCVRVPCVWEASAVRGAPRPRAKGHNGCPSHPRRLRRLCPHSRPVLYPHGAESGTPACPPSAPPSSKRIGGGPDVLGQQVLVRVALRPGDQCGDSRRLSARAR